MNKTKIEWCDVTLPYVKGCKNNCEYCYARKMNDRFKFIPNWNEPQVFPQALEKLKSMKPKNIFVNSMSDIGNWSIYWKKMFYCSANKNSQHNYIFLSKKNTAYYWWMDIYTKQKNVPSNWFFGFSVDTKERLWSLLNCKTSRHIDFLSIEPIMSFINLNAGLWENLRQIIIGAETGNRKGKVIPKKEWIDSLCQQADEYGIKVFMKDSLIPIVGEENMRRELIWNNNNE